MSKTLVLSLFGCALMKAGSLEQEATAFLDRWLVKGEVQKALHYVSERGPLCVPNPETSELSPATPREARERLRAAMITALKTLGKHSSLSEVISPIPANLGHFAGKPGASGLPFVAWDAPDSELRAMTCNSSAKQMLGVIVFVFRGTKESDHARNAHRF